MGNKVQAVIATTAIRKDNIAFSIESLQAMANKNKDMWMDDGKLMGLVEITDEEHRKVMDSMTELSIGCEKPIKKRWIIRTSPGRQPEKKMPVDQTNSGIISMLRDMMKLDPNASFIVAMLTWDDDLWLESGVSVIAEVEESGFYNE